MTLDEIRVRVWERLGDDPATTTAAESNKRYPTTLITTFALEAIRAWSIAVGRDVTSSQITLLNATIEYTFTNQPVRVLSVMNDQTNEPLIPIHWKSLYDFEGFTRNRAWRDVRSDRPTHYSLFSYDKIWLWPAMATASGTITVNFCQETPTDLDSSVTTDVPSVPAEYHHLLVDYIVGRCMMIQSTGPNLERGLGLAKRWIDSFEKQRERHGHGGADFAPGSYPILKGFN